MGYVFHILFALASLAAPELGWRHPEPVLWALIALLLVPHALGAITRRLLVSGRFRLGALGERILNISPVLVQVLSVFALGWLALVARWFEVEVTLAGWPGLEMLAGILPYLAAQLLAIDARARLIDQRIETVRSSRRLHARLLLAALAPFVLYLGLSSLVAFHEALQIHIEEVSLFGAGFSVFVLGVFVFSMPTLLRTAWNTAPLEQGLSRDVLEDVARAADFRCRELLVWRTGNIMANAAIVGFTPRSRVVLFSDALLAELGPRELAAVFAHEIGHARRHHALTFACWALAFFLGADWVMVAFEVESHLVALGALGGMLVVWYLSFGYLSRRFELEADLESMELLGEAEPLVRALVDVTGAHAHERTSWRHFSTAERARFLACAERDPEVARRLRARLRVFRIVGLSLFAVVSVAQLVRLGVELQEDRLVAELRLGRYDDAERRLAASGEVDGQVSRWVRTAAALPLDGRELDALEPQALEAFRAADLERTFDLLELAILRGERVHEVLLELLQDCWGEGVTPSEAALVHLSPAWEAALRTWLDTSPELRRSRAAGASENQTP